MLDKKRMIKKCLSSILSVCVMLSAISPTLAAVGVAEMGDNIEAEYSEEMFSAAVPAEELLEGESIEGSALNRSSNSVLLDNDIVDVMTVDSEDVLPAAVAEIDDETDAWRVQTDIDWVLVNENGTAYYSDTDSDVTIARDNITLTYALEINTQIDNFAVGDIEVRLPYYFEGLSYSYSWKPSSITVPQAPSVNSSYSFNYYIDTTTKEIVFTNAVPIEGTLNQVLQVTYSIPAYYFYDTQTYSLEADLTWVSEESPAGGSATTDPITYTIDTGIDITSVSLYANTNYAEEGRIYAWPSQLYGNEPESFDTSAYNYMAYYTGVSVTNNQAYGLQATITVDSEGEIVYTGNASTVAVWTLLSETKNDDGTTTYVYAASVTNTASTTLSKGIYFAVAYPRTETDTEYNVTVDYTATASNAVVDGVTEDYNDTDVAEKALTTTWQDYEFSYTGSVYSLSKSLQSNSNNLTVLEAEESVTLIGTISATINGYNLGEYQFDVTDDAMYWDFSAASAAYVDMDSDDYRFIACTSSNASAASVTIRGYATDRTNGVESSQTDVITEDNPFILYGKSDGDDDDWEEIAKITAVGTTAVTWDSEKDYTQLKLSSPQGLIDEWYAYIIFGVEVFANTDSYQALSDANQEKTTPYANLSIVNVAGLQIYTDEDNDPTTDYTWYNPSISPTSYMTGSGMDAQDQAIYGDSAIHDDGYVTLSPVGTAGSLVKYCDDVENDTAEGKVTAEFSIAAAVQYTSSVPDSILDDIAIDEGVFYDLLPYGFVYDADSVTVRDANWNDCDVTVELIDNFDGTGRQMVIFSVKTENNYSESGFNFYVFNPTMQYLIKYTNAATGFKLSYTASVDYMYLDIIDTTSYNMVAFQTADAAALPSGLSENVSTRAVFSSVMGEDGNIAYYDINGDGEIGAANTYYAYTSVTVDVATTIENGIKKRVKAEGGSYDVTAQAELDGAYSYAITLGTTMDGSTKDVILYDVLETAYPDNGREGTDYWQGTFAGVDTTVPDKLGIDAVVYYATAGNLDIENETQMDITDTTIWSTVCPTDLSTVTAVAFDLSKGTDGADYIFDGYVMLMVEIFMTAPSETSDAVYAYNEPAYFSTYQGSGSTTVWNEAYNVGQLVTVEIVDLQDFSFTKYGAMEESDDVELSGVTFQLYQCDCGTEHAHTSDCYGILVATSVSDENGLVNFTELASGEYALKETALPYDTYDIETGYWSFTVNHNTGTVTDPTAQDGAVAFTGSAQSGWGVTNQAATVDITVSKIWKYSLDVIQPDSVTYQLYQNNALYATATASSVDDYGYIFTGLAKYDAAGEEYVYTVEEQAVPGYTSTFTSVANESYIFTNSMQGVLQLSKEVVDAPDAAADKEFTFTITLAGTGIDGEYQYAIVDTDDVDSDELMFDAEDTVTFKDSMATVTLKAGESMLIVGLPNGSCTVTETLSNVDALYYTSAYSATLTDTLALDTTSVSHTTGATANTSLGVASLTRVNFTNTYKAGSLTVTKDVYGNAADDDDEFVFEIIFTGSDQEYTYTLTHDDGTTETGTTTDGKVTVKLDEDDVLVFANLPYDLEYEVLQEEVDGDGYVQTYSENHDGVIEGDEAAQFTNYASTVDVHLAVSKEIIGDTPNADATFSFVLTETTDGDTSVLETPETISLVGDGTASFATLRFNSEDDIGTHTYTVSETQGAETGYTYDETVYIVTIVVAIDASGILTATTTYADEGSSTADSMLFSNAYESGTLAITKAVAGDLAETDRDFTFTVTFGEGDNTETYHYTTSDGATGFITGSDSITLQADDTAIFTDLLLGTSYTVTEADYASEGYTTTATDENSSTATSNVISGTITGDAHTATFTNTKEEQTVSTSISLSKDITGGTFPSAASDFEFVLTEQNENGTGSEQTVTITGEDTQSITLRYTDADVGAHVYTLSELDGGITGYTYDETVYTITVNVSYDDSAVLQADVKYTNAAGAPLSTDEVLPFSNGYQASNLVIMKRLEGDLADTADGFSFTLTFSGDGADETYAYTIHRNGSNQIEHEHMTTTETFTLSGGEWIYFEEIPTGMSYTVVEADYSQEGYVTTTTNAEGTLVDGTNWVYFDNEKNASEASVTISLEKVIEGDVPKAISAFEFVLTEQNDDTPFVTTITLNGAGSESFTSIVYTNADVGIHTYTLVEQVGDNANYIYDETIYTIVVDVSYQADGTLQAVARYETDGQAVEALVFTNTYKTPKSVSITSTETSSTEEESTVSPKTADKPQCGAWVLCTVSGVLLVGLLLLKKKNLGAS
ncbi:MAG: FctA domain-containing protein [Faecalibacterium sp.]